MSLPNPFPFWVVAVQKRQRGREITVTVTVDHPYLAELNHPRFCPKYGLFLCWKGALISQPTNATTAHFHFYACLYHWQEFAYAVIYYAWWLIPVHHYVISVAFLFFCVFFNCRLKETRMLALTCQFPTWSSPVLRSFDRGNSMYKQQTWMLTIG